MFEAIIPESFAGVLVAYAPVRVQSRGDEFAGWRGEGRIG